MTAIVDRTSPAVNGRQLYGSVTTSKGQANGTPRLDRKDDGSVTWALTETEHTASGVSKAGGRTVTRPMADVPLVHLVLGLETNRLLEVVRAIADLSLDRKGRAA